MGTSREKPMRIEKLDVTPSLAKEWLGRNALGNRTVSREDVVRIADDMKRGKFELTHESIAFNLAGELVDGQHRLLAVILANVTVTMHVAFDVAVSLKSNINLGRRRSIGFVMGRSNSWIAAMSTLKQLEGGSENTHGIRSTPAQLDEVYSHWVELTDIMMPLATRKYVSGGMIAALIYAGPLNPDLIFRFGEKVRKGEMLAAGSPAFTLRRWFDQDGRIVRPALISAYGALNAIACELKGDSLATIQPGHSGYRWVCTKRRKLGIPYTPTADLVDTNSVAGDGRLAIDEAAVIAAYGGSAIKRRSSARKQNPQQIDLEIDVDASRASRLFGGRGS